MAAAAVDKQKQRAVAVAALLALAGLLVVLSGLTLSASLVGLAVASPVLVLLGMVLVPAALLASLLATGAVVSGALALGALALLSRLAAASTRDYVEEGKRRVGEVAAMAGSKTAHAELAVVSEQGLHPTDHKNAENYRDYVAGRLVGSN
ncbi:hypothetical protein ACP4OV_023341 [Aristida adscensionis]